MKQWNIPVTWEVYSTIVVEADTLEEAMKIAEDDEAEIPCPTDNCYVDGSWRLLVDNEDYIRMFYNDWQTDNVNEEG